MATLKIRNLAFSHRLDVQACKVLRGGMSFGWIRPYQEPSGGISAGGAPLYIGQMTVLLNPVFNQITQTVNQVEFVTVETTENVDSSVNVFVGQRQNGNVGPLPAFA
jgi:hypothetical protein